VSEGERIPPTDRNFGSGLGTLTAERHGASETSEKKHLTFPTKCGRMNMKREEGKPHKPERLPL